MTDRCDVVVVGGRCAGAYLAARIAEAGVNTVVLDRSRFPSDRLSTHILQLNGAAALAHLGLTDELVATGAPPLTGMDVEIDGVDISSDFRCLPGDGPGAFCVRCRHLDVILLRRAASAGAATRTEAQVIGLERRNGRVVGVRWRARDGAERRTIARLVVGADGERSFVARAVGATAYHVEPGERFVVWTYVAPDQARRPRIQFVRDGAEIFVSAPVDGGKQMVLTNPPLRWLPAARRDPAGFLAERCAGSAAMAWASGPVTRCGKAQVVGRCDNIFRTATGAGWALVGDAGRSKDPCTGQGMSDAFRQGEALASAIVDGLRGGDLDARLARWWRWRDRDEARWAAFMAYQGRGGAATELERALLERLAEPRRRSDLSDVFAHRRTPLRAMPPGLVARAWRSAAQNHSVGLATRQLLSLGVLEARWRWRLSSPWPAAPGPQVVRAC